MTLRQIIGTFITSASSASITSLVMGHFTIQSRFPEVNAAMDDMRIKWGFVVFILLIIGVWLIWSDCPCPEDERK